MCIYRTGSLAALLLMLPLIGWSADFEIGLEAYNSADYEAARTEWRTLAEEGNANGQFGMGLLYANGAGVPLDDDQALKWYQLAADQGHAEAQCNLGLMHQNGWGVPINDEEAFKWYSLAAEQGLAVAQISTGRMYESGFGVAQDVVQAQKWYNIAAQLGDSDAPFKRDNLAERMSSEQLAEADSLAIAWIEGHQTLLANH